jgi:SanA protein
VPPWGDAFRALTRPLRRHPRVLKAIAAGLAVMVFVVIASNAYVVLSARGDSTANADDAPHAQVAIVPGALVHDDGEMSAMLADRVHQTAALWDAGKVDRVLVSGDHHTWAYDEPDTMREALIDAGVPAHVIFTDHAGFDTWASMVRARKVFGVQSAIVVTQGFHMPRALYLARAAGLDATGLTADLHGYGKQGTVSDVREILARVKAVGDAALDTGVLLGPPVPITGDARASWGPPPPSGTPPAGAPGATHPSG